MGRLRLTAVIGSLGEVVRYVDDLARAACLPPAVASRFRLAAEELVTNTIVHGYGTIHGPWQKISLESGVEADRVWLRIVDEAPPFDPTRSAPPNDLDAPLAERSPGGLGLYLAQRSVDSMTYEYADGRNHVTLQVYRGADAAARTAAPDRMRRT